MNTEAQHTTEASKSKIFNLRLTAQERELLSEASKLTGQTMTDFLKRSSLPAAQDIVNERRAIAVSLGAWNDFWNKIENPSPVPEHTRRAAAACVKEWAENNNL